MPGVYPMAHIGYIMLGVYLYGALMLRSTRELMQHSVNLCCQDVGTNFRRAEHVNPMTGDLEPAELLACAGREEERLMDAGCAEPWSFRV